VSGQEHWGEADKCGGGFITTTRLVDSDHAECWRHVIGTDQNIRATAVLLEIDSLVITRLTAITSATLAAVVVVVVVTAFTLSVRNVGPCTRWSIKREGKQRKCRFPTSPSGIRGSLFVTPKVL